ncbi:hypothetical protein M3Y99_00779400 [Aphelenchoides fujianensis]|nr:hypothetical protein M3Y99_00779400 [Aphelenchoides fujianensis]
MSAGWRVAFCRSLSWLEDYYKKITGYATPVPDEPAPPSFAFDRHIHEQADEAGPSSRPAQRAEDEDDKYTDAEILEYLRLHKRPPNFRSQEVDKRRMCDQLMDDADAVVLKRPVYRSASFEIFDRTNGKW